MATVKENKETITRSRLVGLKDICVAAVTTNDEDVYAADVPVRLYNLLGMVQAGTLEAAELREVINGIEEEKYIFVPVVEISEDKRYITTNYLAEAEKGAKVLCEGKEYTIKSVEHVAVEQQSQGEDTGEAKEEKKTVIGVNADLETTAEKVGVESPVNILDTLGITQGELDSIKGVLARYE